MFRTQNELSNAMVGLFNDPDFKVLLKQQAPSVRKKFQKMANAMPKGRAFLKDVRNEICGHVRESAVRRALHTMPFDSFGMLDIGRKSGDLRYGFTEEIVAGILLKGVRKRERAKGTSQKFRSIAAILPMFTLVEYCFAMYARNRALIDMLPLE